MGTRGCLAYGEWALVAVLIASLPKRFWQPPDWLSTCCRILSTSRLPAGLGAEYDRSYQQLCFRLGGDAANENYHEVWRLLRS